MDFKCNLWVLLCIFAHLSMETKALDLSQNSGRQVCYRSSTIYMSFDKFLLDVESRDLPQAGKKILWVSSFSKLGLSSIQESSGLTWTFCKMNTLNPLKFTSHQKNWEKCLLFNQTVDSITPELKFCKIEKEHTLIILLSAWERSRDSTAKINLSKDMSGTLDVMEWVL